MALLAGVLLVFNSPDTTEGNDGKNATSGQSLEQQLSGRRNLYVGDHIADGTLIGLLPVPTGRSLNRMELETEEEAYGLKLSYLRDRDVTREEGIENADTMLRNAVYLFATIENMDICTFETSGQGTEDAVYTRNDLEAIFGSLYERSETEAGMKALTQEINGYLEGK